MPEGAHRSAAGDGLRIGLVIDRLDPGRGGAESYLIGLSRFLGARGHDVHLLAQRFGPLPDRVGTPVRVPGASRPRPWRDLSFDRLAARAARAHRIDVTLGVRHTPSTDVFQPHGGVYSRAAAAQSRSSGQARHRLGRALSPKHRALLRLEAAQARRDGVTYVALSERVRADMVDAYRLSEADAPTLLYNGVDLERFRPRPARRADARRAHGLSDDDVCVLFVAHNFRLKGLQHLIAAVARVSSSRLRVLVVGRGDPAPFAALASHHGVGERVAFVGAVDDPLALFAAADVLAHPTYYDPCSCVCLEALACGVPVVTTARNGVGERIAAYGGGVVIDDAPDESALASALARLADDDAHRRALGEAARALAERHDEREAFAAMEAVLVETAAEVRR